MAGRRAILSSRTSAKDLVETFYTEIKNGRLKRIVADLTLDNAMLKEVAKGNF